MLDRATSRKGADRLRHFVLKGIGEGSLIPGDKLPTEREFMRRFTAARSAVRKTLQSLEFEGRIVQEVGRGTFVAVPDAAQTAAGTFPFPLDAGPVELMDARLVIEPALIEMIITNATAGDIEAMEICLARAEKATTLRDFENHDNALHQAFVDATHNGFLIRLYALVTALRQRAEWGKLKERSLTPERRIIYQREHRRIVQWLKRRDAGRARSALLTHLQHVRHNLFELGNGYATHLEG
jgi:DNA-binding FadR family transcriptional regulator